MQKGTTVGGRFKRAQPDTRRPRRAPTGDHCERTAPAKQRDVELGPSTEPPDVRARRPDDGADTFRGHASSPAAGTPETQSRLASAEHLLTANIAPLDGESTERTTRSPVGEVWPCGSSLCPPAQPTITTRELRRNTQPRACIDNTACPDNTARIDNRHGGCQD
jgi:hypothetical protein